MLSGGRTPYINLTVYWKQLVLRTRGWSRRGQTCTRVLESAYFDSNIGFTTLRNLCVLIFQLQNPTSLHHLKEYTNPEWLFLIEDILFFRLKDENSGRAVQIFSDQPCLYLSVGNELAESPAGKGKWTSNSGVLLQTGNFPDAVHHVSGSVD